MIGEKKYSNEDILVWWLVACCSLLQLQICCREERYKFFHFCFKSASESDASILSVGHDRKNRPSRKVTSECDSDLPPTFVVMTVLTKVSTKYGLLSLHLLGTVPLNSTTPGSK